jgi:hypothetical protein
MKNMKLKLVKKKKKISMIDQMKLLNLKRKEIWIQILAQFLLVIFGMQL